jgi:hypothetical protein
MKALVWNNPYGSLMIHGKGETRPRHTEVRGEVLICTAKKSYAYHKVLGISGERQMYRMADLLGLTYDTTKYPGREYEGPWYGTKDPTIKMKGYAIAVGTLVDSRPMTPKDEDFCFVEYFPELFVWVFENVRKIQPFKWEFGKQGWLNVPESELSKIIYL